MLLCEYVFFNMFGLVLSFYCFFIYVFFDNFAEILVNEKIFNK